MFVEKKSKKPKPEELSQKVTFEQHLLTLKVEDSLSKLLISLSRTASLISSSLRSATVSTLSSVNIFGDQQLNVDVIADKICFSELKKSGLIATASSEENPNEINLEGNKFSIAFDPLDGSSIIDANFSVGSIFGIWPGTNLLNRSGNEQVAAAVVMYGPRTSIIFAISHTQIVTNNNNNNIVFETSFNPNDNLWYITNTCINVKKTTKYFAPGNLRSTFDNPNYKALVKYWIDNKFTLRYSGGLVPDIYHILIKGEGILTNPVSSSAKAKLRLLYEALPIAFIFHSCRGKSSTGKSCLLDEKIILLDQRTSMCVGSEDEVLRFQSYNTCL